MSARKRFAPLLLLVILALVFGACAPAATAPAAEGEAAAPAEEAAAPEGGRTFRVWWYENGNGMDIAWKDALADFQAAHPDVTVEFELKTFQQIQETARMILNSQDVPDVLEINKGNATAGLYSMEGLLTNLDEVAAERGWADKLSSSIQTTARYNEQGIMGTGSLYGIPTYGEYVLVYYNKDMFAERGMEIPTTLEEFEAILDKFVAEGIVPITVGGSSSWTLTHNWQELMLYKADRELINNFQFLTGDVDFQGEAFTYGATKFQEHVQKGYYGDNVNGVIDDDSNNAFVQGQYPIRITGSWQFGNFMTQITDFDWGMFLMPGKQYTTGSAGNMWAVPANAKNKDLAYDFIDLTLAPKSQTIMANNGGIPVAADLEAITDEKSKELNEGFAAIVANDGFAFYPDWPAPGYMETIGSALQQLVAGEITPAEMNELFAAPYNEYKSTLQ